MSVCFALRLLICMEMFDTILINQVYFTGLASSNPGIFQITADSNCWKRVHAICQLL